MVVGVSGQIGLSVRPTAMERLPGQDCAMIQCQHVEAKIAPPMKMDLPIQRLWLVPLATAPIHAQVSSLSYTGQAKCHIHLLYNL